MNAHHSCLWYCKVDGCCQYQGCCHYQKLPARCVLQRPPELHKRWKTQPIFLCSREKAGQTEQAFKRGHCRRVKVGCCETAAPISRALSGTAQAAMHACASAQRGTAGTAALAALVMNSSCQQARAKRRPQECPQVAKTGDKHAHLLLPLPAASCKVRSAPSNKVPASTHTQQLWPQRHDQAPATMQPSASLVYTPSPS